MAYGPRQRLNRRDPRLAGVVTWLPLEGTGLVTGDVGGQLPIVGGAFTHVAHAGVGLTVPGGGSSAANSAIRADRMGVAGAARRTMFVEITHPDTNALINYLTLGNGATRQDFSLVSTSGVFRRLQLNFWGGDHTFDISSTGGTGFVVRLVVTYDGGTGITARWRSMRESDGVWEGVGSSSFTLGGPLETQDAAAVATNWWNAVGGSSGEARARLHFAGYVGGYAWSEAEALAFLVAPQDLWRAAPMPHVIGSRSANPAGVSGDVAVTLPIGASADAGAALGAEAVGLLPLAAAAQGQAEASAAAAATLSVLGEAVAGDAAAAAAAATLPVLASAAVGDAASAAAAASLGLVASADGGPAATGAAVALLDLGALATGAQEEVITAEGAAVLSVSAIAAGGPAAEALTATVLGLAAGGVAAAEMTGAGAAELAVTAAATGSQVDEITAQAVGAVPVLAAAAAAGAVEAGGAVVVPLAVTAAGGPALSAGAAVTVPLAAAAIATEGTVLAGPAILARLAVARRAERRLALVRPVVPGLLAARAVRAELRVGEAA